MLERLLTLAVVILIYILLTFLFIKWRKIIIKIHSILLDRWIFFVKIRAQLFQYLSSYLRL